MLRVCSTALAIAAVLGACSPSEEMSGIYISQAGVGALFPCDDARIRFVVQDSALDARADAAHPAFVRLRGVKSRSGSPKGGGQRHFQVQQILEVRERASGECPGVAPSIAPLLSTP